MNNHFQDENVVRFFPDCAVGRFRPQQALGQGAVLHSTRMALVLVAVAMSGVTGSVLGAGRPAPVVQAIEVNPAAKTIGPGGLVDPTIRPTAIPGARRTAQFQAAAGDAPAERPNHPPLESIPFMPMPMPPPPGALANGGVAMDRSIIYDAETRQAVELPSNPLAAVGGLAGGHGGGYAGADGGGSMSEPGSLATFASSSRISNTADHPWRMNVKLLMRFVDQGGTDRFFVCSGSMIEANVVLCAAHCVYARNPNGINIFDWAREIWVYPGWDGVGTINPPDTTINPYGWARGTYFLAGTDYINNGNFDRDAGLICIGRPVGMLTGWFSWAWGYDCGTIQGRTYNNASYPAESCGMPGLHNGRGMYFWSGQFDSCPGNQLRINTSGGCFNAGWGGMSGSSAYWIDGESRFAHAVASTSDRATIFNFCKLWEQLILDMNNTFVPACRSTTFDLQPMDANFEPASIQAGNSTTLQDHLAANATGGTKSGTHTFRIYLSANDNISSSGDVLLSEQSYSWDFAVASNVRVNMGSVTIPIGTPPGTYWLGVEYDSATDGNFDNNSTDGWDAVRITVTAPPAPSNDNFVNRIALAGTSGTTFGSNFGATEESGEPDHFGNPGGKSVWWQWTAPSSGTATFDTFTSSFDTLLAVYTGTAVNGLTPVASNDDFGGVQSQVTFAAAAGVSYKIAVDGFNGASGNITLHWSHDSGGFPLAGLSLWLKADTGVSGAAVSQWNDQSGNNRHAIQATGGSQPALVSGVLNGLPIVRFDGVNDFLTFNLSVNTLGGMTVFLVAANTQNQTPGASQGERAALFWNETAGWGSLYLTPFQSSVAMRFGTTQAGNQPLYNRPSSIGSAFSVTTSLKNGTTDSLFVNGTQVLSQGGKLATIAGCRDTGNVGRGYNDNTHYAGDIAEALVYNRALTAAERQQVEQYLNAKWLSAPATPTITVAATDATAGEPGSGQGPGEFTFSRTGSTAAALTVNFTVVGSATSPSDYGSIGTSVSFAASSATAVTTVTVLDDGAVEGDETVVVTLAGGAGYSVGSPNSATVTIQDDDGGGFPLSGLSLWLKADTGVSGAAVSQWNDQSGNNRHATQATGASQPALVSGALNGLPIVRFDGVNDFLTFNLPVNTLGGMTVFLVAANTQNQTPGASQGERAALFWNETLGWGSLYLTPFQSSVAMRFGTTQVGNQPLYNRPSSIGSAFSMTTALKNGTTDTLFVNGTQVLSQGGKLATIAGCRDTGNVGRGYNDNTHYAGDIAEALVYNRALSAAERQQVEQYLNAKWLSAPATPTITVAATDATAGEPGSGQGPGEFTFSRTGSTAAGLTVNFTVGGSATSPSDYGSIGTSVSFAAGSATAIATVTVLDDGAVEGDETVVVTLAGGAGYSVGSPNSATVTIQDDDGGGFPLAGLSLWLKADTGVSGAAVSQWNDQSGNNRHATQATGASQPALVSGVLNGLPIVRFDGVNDFLTFNLPVNTLGGMTVFLVAANTQNQTPGASQGERAALFWNETAGWGSLYLTPFQSSVAMRFGTTQVGNQPLYNRPSSIGSAFSVTTSLKNGTTDTLFVNGTQVLSQGGKLATIAGCRDTGNVGRGYNDNTHYAGDIAEALVYNRALTAAERQQVEQYLNAKWLSAPATPTITVAATDATAGEPGSGQGPGEFTFSRTGSTAAALTVNFTVGGSATSPSDYGSIGTSVGFVAGSATAIATVNVLDDGAVEGDETVVVTLAGGAGYSVGAPSSATVTIQDDDGGGFPLSGLSLWLKADTGVSGAAVSQWNDQSGNNRHATQATGASQPALVSGALNGLPIVRFDGVNDFLTFNLPVNTLGGMTVFLVAANTQNQTPGASQGERAALFWNETAGWGSLYLTPFQSSVAMRFGTTQAGNQPLYNRPSSIGSAFSMTTALKNSTTDTLFVNGTQVLSQGNKLATIAGCRDTGNVGRGYNDNTHYAGDIAEALVYNRALTAAERQQVEQYLRTRYALPLSSLFVGNSTLPMGGLRLTLQPAPETAGVWQLAVEGSAGKTYVIERSDDLFNWTAAATITVPQNRSAVLPQSLTGATGFFRARTE